MTLEISDMEECEIMARPLISLSIGVPRRLVGLGIGREKCTQYPWLSRSDKNRMRVVTAQIGRVFRGKRVRRLVEVFSSAPAIANKTALVPNLWGIAAVATVDMSPFSAGRPQS